MKKFATMAISVALIGTMIAGGSLAYLQSEDSDVNVMTLGNVSIEQLEYQRALNEDGTYKTATIDDRTSYVLEPFTQGKELLPSALNTTTWEGWGWDGTPVRNSQVGSYGGMSVFKDASNAQDKFVYVKNTGKTDAYVRTLIAVEVGDSNINMMNFNVHLGAWTENEIGTITVDDNNYYVLEYVYTGAQLSDGSWRHENGILPAGDMTYNSFAQVYIHSKATNEDMVAIDGNGNGTLDILVLSQAVQAAGFENAQTALDTAFGKASEKAAGWFGGEEFATPTAVATAEELTAAIEAGESVYLTEDIALTEVVEISQDVVIDGNGNTLTTDATRGFRVTTSDVAVTLNDVVVDTKAVGAYNNDARGISIDGNLSNVTVTLNNCTVDFADGAAADWAYGVNISGGTKDSTIIINGGYFEGANVVNIWGTNNTIVIDGATLNCTYGDNASYHGSGVRLNPGCTADITVKNTTITGTNAVAFCACGVTEGTYTYTAENIVDKTTE